MRLNSGVRMMGWGVRMMGWVGQQVINVYRV